LHLELGGGSLTSSIRPLSYESLYEKNRILDIWMRNIGDIQIYGHLSHSYNIASIKFLEAWMVIIL